MPDDYEIHVPLGYDTSITPTDEKLASDAASLANQYLQFWLPGEVEVTVILSRPDARKVTYATSVTRRERLLHALEEVKDASKIQTLLIHGNRGQRK